MPKEKYLLILALMVIATAMAVGFVFWSNRNLPAQTLEKKQKAANPCFGLSADKGEITCEEAKTIALKELPGAVLNIDKKDVSFIDPKGKNYTYHLWLITVRLDKPIKNRNEFVVGVDVADGKIKYSGVQ